MASNVNMHHKQKGIIENGGQMMKITEVRQQKQNDRRVKQIANNT
jgi:hypothetical protein